MSFQTNTIVDGVWTTRTLDVDAVLRHHDQQDIEANANLPQVEKTPTLGILTQTVVRSPLIHYILPAKLRGPDFNDVAFIGEDFVQIKELRGDGFLWDLIRKENFGARIRNARIVGSVEEFRRDPDVLIGEPQVKDEDGDVDMDGDEDPRRAQNQNNTILPPQFLLLQLETGDSIFLMLRQSANAKLEFVITTRHRVSKIMLHIQPGMHLSVDPSSRYMAIACSEAQVAIYELKSREQLKGQYAKGSDLHHVIADRFIAFDGVIQKMEFLYPSTEDEDYVVLLVLVVIRGKTRIMVYEWKTGDDIHQIRALSHKGHTLGPAHQMPLLLIPLRFKSTFILVSEKRMALFQNILEGVPKCIEFYTRSDPPTTLHHGSGVPLWAAWARPVARTDRHSITRDDIYIAREDGLLKFLEIDCENFVEGDMNVGDFEGRCGTALASLDYRNSVDVTGDLLVTGGDSCAGGAYLVLARKTPTFTQPIENWTPAQDFITTSTGQGKSFYLGLRAKSMHNDNFVPKPDRIFACVGKGSKGAITEFRYGLEARIGLQMEYELPITQAWSLPTGVGSFEDGDGSLFLLSLGETSVALHMSSDETKIETIDDNTINLDLRYRTVAVNTQGSCTVQVTEQSIVLINEAHSCIYERDQLLRVPDERNGFGLGAAICDAVIDGTIVLYTTFVENSMFIQLFGPKFSEDPHSVLNASSVTSNYHSQTLGKFSTHITSLALYLKDKNMFAIVAEWLEGSITLTFLSIDGTTERRTLEIASFFDNDIRVEAIVSIAVISRPSNNLVLLCGTRNGLLLTLEIDEELTVLNQEYNRIGATSVMVKRDELSCSDDVFFLSCDYRAYVSEFGNTGHPNRIRINQIWLTDAQSPGLRQPGITSVVGQISMFGNGTDARLLLVAGSQLLLASLSTSAKAVPRHLQIGGTPSRLLYSQNLDVLVVAASVDGKSTLIFIDPDTGEDLSSPIEHKGGLTARFVSGLGNSEERIYRLFEWSYVKDAKTWNFIIVSTSTGRLLIISIEDQDRIRKEFRRPNGHINGTGIAGRRSKIAYYTRHKFKCPEPVYSVTGFSDGLLWCTGEKLLCDVLDLNEKRFKRVAEYELPSMAINLEFDGGTIYVLTQSHSLEVLQLIRSNDGNYEIARKYGDQFSRYALHHTPIAHDGDRPTHLISDKCRSIVGLWPTKDAKADTLETIFEGQLPSSILRFRATRCRPIWDPVWRFNSTSTDPSIPLNSITLHEVLGISIDGSLIRFTILDRPAWKFLRFLINLCIRSSTVCEFSYQDDPLPLDVVTEPKTMMQVDGDILKRCLDERRLEELLCVGATTTESRRVFSQFYDLLQLLHRESLQKNAAPQTYIERAYADLEIYLRPTL